jgi:hypothetical protein
MNGSVRAVGSRVHGLHPGRSNGTASLDDLEATQKVHLQAERTTTYRAKRSRPAWWLLYSLLPLTIVLFLVADQAPQAHGWRIASELIAAFVIVGAIALWVHANRMALILSTYGADSKGFRDQA